MDNDDDRQRLAAFQRWVGTGQPAPRGDPAARLPRTGAALRLHVGQAVKAARLARGLSRDAAEAAAGYPHRGLERLEEGQVRQPPLEGFARLCRLLGLSADELLGIRANTGGGNG